MRRRDLLRHLAREAARVMPAAEARKFRAIMEGGKPASLPGDGLPPITTHRDSPRAGRASWAGNRWVYRQGQPSRNLL